MRRSAPRLLRGSADENAEIDCCPVPRIADRFRSSAQSPEPTPAFPGQTDAPAPARPSPPFNVETIATGLTGAWSVAFLPDGNFLILQGSGTMRIGEAERLRLRADRGRAGGEAGRRAGAARCGARPGLRAQPHALLHLFRAAARRGAGHLAAALRLRGRLDQAPGGAPADEDRHGTRRARPPQRR